MAEVQMERKLWGASLSMQMRPDVRGTQLGDRRLAEAGYFRDKPADTGKVNRTDQLEFEYCVFDCEADVAIGFRQAADCFRLVYLGFEHHKGDWNATAGALDSVHGCFAVDMAGSHEDADAALNQFGVLHVYVNHQVFVHVAEARHGAGGDHVQDHLLG